MIKNNSFLNSNSRFRFAGLNIVCCIENSRAHHYFKGFENCIKNFQIIIYKELNENLNKFISDIFNNLDIKNSIDKDGNQIDTIWFLLDTELYENESHLKETIDIIDSEKYIKTINCNPNFDIWLLNHVETDVKHLSFKTSEEIFLKLSNRVALPFNPITEYFILNKAVINSKNACSENYGDGNYIAGNNETFVFLIIEDLKIKKILN